MENIVFKEQQYFNDKMVFILLGTGVIGSLFSIMKVYLNGQLTVESAFIYSIIMAVLVSLIWGLKQLRLRVSVNDKRIKYKLFPLHDKAHRISWEEVASCEIIKTPAAAQWHGGNIRFSGESWYSFTGRNGLSVETKDGRRIFIGCKNVDELTNTISKLSI